MPRIHGIPVSPRARRAIGSRNLDLASIKGSGPKERIVEADLKTQTPPNEMGLSEMRKAIARGTTASYAIPQFQLKAEIDVTEMLRFRQERLAEIEQVIGVRLTVTDVILKALASALVKCPEANSIWRGDSIQRLKEANIGLVTSVPGGLHIPILARVQALTLPELAQLRRETVDAIRAGKLTQSALSAASSISNLGNSRVDEFTAILAQGQTTMLAVGRIAPRPWIAEGKVVARPTAKLCLAVDHRVMDGEPAATFLGHLIEGLEHPSSLFH